MSLFGNPRPGDWVKTTEPIKRGLSDYLMGPAAGIKVGTRGVITRSCGWNALEARLESGLLGAVTVRVKPSQVRVVRRGAGVGAFSDSASRRNAMRFGVAAALVLPLAYFALVWFLRGGTVDGLVVAVLEGVIAGVLDLAMYSLDEPIRALVYVGIVTMAARFAYRT